MLHPFRFEFVTPRWRSEVPRGRAHRFGDRAGLTLIDAVDRLDLFAVAVADAHNVQHRSLAAGARSEEHTSELPSLMRISYAVFCLKEKQQHVIPIKVTEDNKQGVDQ